MHGSSGETRWQCFQCGGAAPGSFGCSLVDRSLFQRSGFDRGTLLPPCGGAGFPLGDLFFRRDPLLAFRDSTGVGPSARNSTKQPAGRGRRATMLP